MLLALFKNRYPTRNYFESLLDFQGNILETSDQQEFVLLRDPDTRDIFIIDLTLQQKTFLSLNEGPRYRLTMFVAAMAAKYTVTRQVWADAKRENHIFSIKLESAK